MYLISLNYFLVISKGTNFLFCVNLLVLFIGIGLSEPGYYENGEFGIRLENVLVVKEADTKFNFGDKGYLSFEHITWVSPNLCISLGLVYFRGMFIFEIYRSFCIYSTFQFVSQGS